MKFFDDKDTFTWYDTLEQLLPYRLTGENLAGSWFWFLNATIAQTIEQAMLDSYLYRQTSVSGAIPSDGLALVGEEAGIPAYVSLEETYQLSRIQNKWDNLKYYGQANTITDLIFEAGLGTAEIKYNLVAQHVDQSPAKAGPIIPAHPSSVDHPSQFAVIIKIPTVLGTGSESDIVTDEQLANIRNLIKLAKPVQHVCRKIYLVHPGTGLYWGSGAKYGDGSQYGDTGPVISEKHAFAL